jgi:hypothetical protein
MSTGDPQSGDQRQELDAEILQRHDCEQEDHQRARHPRQELHHGWLEVEPPQAALDRARDPARDEKTHRQNQYRHQQLRSEADGQIDQCVLGVRQRIELTIHLYPLACGRPRTQAIAGARYCCSSTSIQSPRRNRSPPASLYFFVYDLKQNCHGLKSPLAS